MSENEKIKVHFRDTWTVVSTGVVQDIEYSTETIHVYDEETATAQVERAKSRAGVSVLYGIEHKCEVIGVDGIKTGTIKLTKEQMMDFILEHNVTLALDGSMWTGTDGKKTRKKYIVTIDNVQMQGYDLEDAINEYANRKRK